MVRSVLVEARPVSPTCKMSLGRDLGTKLHDIRPWRAEEIRNRHPKPNRTQLKTCQLSNDQGVFEQSTPEQTVFWKHANVHALHCRLLVRARKEGSLFCWCLRRVAIRGFGYNGPRVSGRIGLQGL